MGLSKVLGLRWLLGWIEELLELVKLLGQTEGL